MNFKPAFIFSGQAKPSVNGEVYATKEEAMASAAQRFSVWTMPIDYTAVETEDPVNRQWIAGQGSVPFPNPDGRAPHAAPAQVQIA